MRPVDPTIPITLGYRQVMASRPGYIHRGVDYGAPVGTLVHATAPGVVEYVGQGGGNGPACGLHIIINVAGIRCAYYHLSQSFVRLGQTVPTGTVIGHTGATGNVTGPHLHYQEQTGQPGYYTTDRDPQFNKETPVTVRTCVDYSDARPDLKALKAQGHEGVIRYLSSIPGPKVITRAEAEAIHGAGLWFFLVYEDGTSDPTLGAPEGTKDGQTAAAQATALGYQRDATIVLAFDRNDYVLEGPVLEYAQAWIKAVTDAGFLADIRARGGYGDYAVAHNSIFGMHWKVETWGGDNTSIHLLQMVNSNPRPTPGCDTNVILHSFPVCTTLNPPGWTPPPPAPVGEPQWFHNARRELVMGIGGTTASTEWGRRYRIANNIATGKPCGAKVGTTTEPVPPHAANAITDLKAGIPTTTASNIYGHRARQMYNVLRGLQP